MIKVLFLVAALVAVAYAEESEVPQPIPSEPGRQERILGFGLGGMLGLAALGSIAKPLTLLPFANAGTRVPSNGNVLVIDGSLPQTPGIINQWGSGVKTPIPGNPGFFITSRNAVEAQDDKNEEAAQPVAAALGYPYYYPNFYKPTSAIAYAYPQYAYYNSYPYNAYPQYAYLQY